MIRMHAGSLPMQISKLPLSGDLEKEHAPKPLDGNVIRGTLSLQL